MTGALAVKGFNEISFEELMDVNGGSLTSFGEGCVSTAEATGAVSAICAVIP